MSRGGFLPLIARHTRSLDMLEWRVEQGNLMIQYQDFRLGIPQKEVA